MVFSSPLFLFLYLPLVLACYFVVPGIRNKNWVLLVFSLTFYILGEGHYVGVMAASIILAYISGVFVARAHDEKSRRIWVGIAVVSNLSLLFYYKYMGFFAANVGPLLENAGLKMTIKKDVHLPVGISFFIFQAISYVLDVHRHKIPVQKNIFKLAVYKSFFPQLIAGPIVRYAEVGRELEKRTSSVESFCYGAQRFVLGLGKKVLLANSMGALADKVFQVSPNELNASLAWIGGVAYFFQIYFDFSGYSDMAIGLARIFGFRFNENFLYPYISQSITEFWRRWHISLSSWFRDYVYIPLGGNRKSKWRTYLNLFLIFILCGLWHGASWNFVAWGVFHGFFLVFERAIGLRILEKVPKFLRHGYVIFLVIISWILFRADNLGIAMSMIQAMMGLGKGSGVVLPLPYILNVEIFIVAIACCLFSTPIIEKLKWPFQDPSKNLKQSYSAQHFWSGGLIVLFIFVLSLVYLASNTFNPFIYYRF